MSTADRAYDARWRAMRSTFRKQMVADDLFIALTNLRAEVKARCAEHPALSAAIAKADEVLALASGEFPMPRAQA
jgi:hypothetical protein